MVKYTQTIRRQKLIENLFFSLSISLISLISLSFFSRASVAIVLKLVLMPQFSLLSATSNLLNIKILMAFDSEEILLFQICGILIDRKLVHTSLSNIFYAADCVLS